MEVPKPIPEPSGVRISDFQLDEEPTHSPTQDAPAGSLAQDAPTDILSAFQLEQGDENLPRPAPIRTSSMRKKTVSPVTCEIEEAPMHDSSSGSGKKSEETGGWGWNIGSMGGLLKKVAADVAGEVKDLTASLQHAFQEEDEVEEEGWGRDGAKHEGDGHANKDVENEDVPGDEQQQMRTRVLERLQGEDTSLEHGLKAIDDQVENLAAGVGKALGSLWGGLGGAMKGAQTIASKVESAAKTATKDLVYTMEGGVKDVQELGAVKKAQSGLKAAAGMGGKLAMKAEQHIENIGRRAIALLENSGGPRDDSDDGVEVPEEMVTFDSSFYIYGGQQHYEELEGLCNECAKKCNKSRASLDGPHKEQLDEMLTFLHPIFEVEGSPTESEDEDGDCKTVDTRFLDMYGMVTALTAGSSEKASAMAQRAENQLQDWIDETAELPSPPSSPGGLESPNSVHPQLKIQPSIAASEGRRILQQIHEEGIKRLAELCTCCIECLLQVGKSLQQEEEDQKEQESAVWPEKCEETSNLLRGYTVRLVHDLEAVAGAFVEALLGVGTACQETLGDSSLRQKSSWLASDLEVDARTAVGRIKDGFRNLLYVVLCTTLTEEKNPI